MFKSHTSARAGTVMARSATANSARSTSFRCIPAVVWGVWFETDVLCQRTETEVEIARALEATGRGGKLTGKMGQTGEWQAKMRRRSAAPATGKCHGTARENIFALTPPCPRSQTLEPAQSCPKPTTLTGRPWLALRSSCSPWWPCYLWRPFLPRCAQRFFARWAATRLSIFFFSH